MLGAHPGRIVVATNGDADNARPPQPLQRPGDIRPVAVRRRLVIEEVANMGEEARMMGDGVVHGGAKRLTQTLAALVTALRRETWQRWRQMVVAGHDDANEGRC